MKKNEPTFGRDRALHLFENTIKGCWSPGEFDGEPDALIEEAYRLHCGCRLMKIHRPMEWARLTLQGKNLACWCPLPQSGEPDKCHAAVLLRLANEC